MKLKKNCNLILAVFLVILLTAFFPVGQAAAAGEMTGEQAAGVNLNVPEITNGTAVLSLDSPTSVMTGSGFYLTINIAGAVNLHGFSLHVHFNPDVIQVQGSDGVLGGASGVSDGLINGETIPITGWIYQPIPPGTPSGEIQIVGLMPGFTTHTSGSGYLAKVHFKALGASGNTTSLSLSDVNLLDYLGNETFPDNPTPVLVTVSDNPAQVTSVATQPATAITITTATLNGELTAMGTAATVNLSLGYSITQGGPYTLIAGPTVNSTPAPVLPLAFSANITGLLPGTTYYCIAQAQYDTQTVTGGELSFLTSGEPLPALTSLNPSSGAPGTALTGVIINGFNLSGATGVNFSGTGITATNVIPVNDIRVLATITISSSAAPGPRDVTVTAAGGTSAPLSGGFTVGSLVTATVVLDAPALAPAGGGFYVSVNITDASLMTAYQFNISFNSTVVQMAGLDLVMGSGSGIIDGLVNGVVVPNTGWSCLPFPGIPSGSAKVLGKLPNLTTASGSGYLARIHFNVVGQAGSQTSFTLSGISLFDPATNATYPASPSPLTVTVSDNPSAVTLVATQAPTNPAGTAATLNGALNGMGTASTVSLFLGYALEQGGPYTLIPGPVVNSTPAPSLPLSFSANITGLVSGLQYYCIAQAQFNGQIVCGAEMPFTSNNGRLPSLTSLSPESGVQGSTVYGVVFSGTNLTGTTAISFNGTGLIAGNITVLDATWMAANIIIDEAAETGPRDVTVTTAGGTSAPLTGGFNVTAPTSATVSLEAPVYVAPGSGFYATVKISGVNQLSTYNSIISFNSTTVQMAGLDSVAGSGSGIEDGLVHGVTIHNTGWEYQPDPGIPGDWAQVSGNVQGSDSASGSGYLARIHFKVTGPAGSQTELDLLEGYLEDKAGNPINVDYGGPITVKVSDDPGLAAETTTQAATSVTPSRAALHGTLVKMGPAATVNLSLGFALEQGGPYNLVAGPIVNSTPDPGLPLAFSANITGLLPNTTYFGIAQAEYDGLIVSGSEIIFTTPYVGPAARLSFAQHPTSAAVNAVISPAVTVEVRDAAGNLVTTDSSTQVTLAVGNNPGGGLLSGNTTVTAIMGVATFNNLSIDKVGSGYSLTASSSPVLTGAISNAFNITSGAANKLVFGQQPASVIAGAFISPAVTVEVKDALDNRVTADSSTQVTLAIGANPGGGVLSGNTTVAAVMGVATFNNLSIDKVGSGYSLTASSSPVLTGAASSSFDVIPVLEITSTAVMDLEVGVPCGFPLQASGGVLPYAWTMQSGTLPDGLSLSTSGNITGTPTTAAGPTDIAFKVTDNRGTEATKTITVTVYPHVAITTSSPLADGQVAVPYLFTLTVSGGAPLYLWEVQSGSLPAGLTFNSSGSLSGTPTEACEAREVVLKVTDRLAGVASQGFLITVLGALSVTSVSPLADGIAGEPYSQNLTASGGKPPYNWSLQSGSLPPGLMLQSSGNLTGTPTLTGNFTFTVDVIDAFNPAQTASKVLSVSIRESEASVKVVVALQKGSRPDAGWVVPLTVKFFVTGNETPADVMKDTPAYSFDLTTVKEGNTATALATALAAGVYDISATSEHCLCNVKRNVSISVPLSTVDMGTLLEGDADGNHKVNIQDFGILAKTYGKSASSGDYDPRADFDRSGNVNITDFGLLASNYSKYCPITVP